MPQCWVTPDGTIEYIFDVTLASSGIFVRDNALPDQAEDEKNSFLIWHSMRFWMGANSSERHKGLYDLEPCSAPGISVFCACVRSNES
jgi:hypothetical protein